MPDNPSLSERLREIIRDNRADELTDEEVATWLRMSEPELMRYFDRIRILEVALWNAQQYICRECCGLDHYGVCASAMAALGSDWPSGPHRAEIDALKKSEGQYD